MGTASFGGSFVPIVQYEKWKIHPVFPHFSYFRSGQNTGRISLPHYAVLPEEFGILRFSDIGDPDMRVPVQNTSEVFGYPFPGGCPKAFLLGRAVFLLASGMEPL